MNLAHRALSLWSTGPSAGCGFPSWAADEWEAILPRFGPTAKVYHASDDLAEVRTTATFREPTNIAMNRMGSCRTLDEFYRTVLLDGSDGRLFAELFPDGRFSDDGARDAAIRGYYRAADPARSEAACSDAADGPGAGKEGGRAAAGPYRKELEGAYRFTDGDHRMPQIAAYARTPMRYWHRGTLLSNDEGVHVLSLVGAGFDSRRQPDARYYFDASARDIRADRRGEFYRERQVAFAIALQCAFDHRLDRIEFVAVGAGHFSFLLPPGRVLGVQKAAWESEEVQAYKSVLEGKLGGEIAFSFRTEPPFSHNNGMGTGTPSFYEQSGWTGDGHGKDHNDAINRTLFINAWDPWSLVGNGNEMDSSVDGYYGRQSALALLCWPVTNPHIQFKKIEF